MANTPSSDDEKNLPLTVHQILSEEFTALGGWELENYNKTADQADNKRLTALIKDLHKQPRAALCLSGGGIRSATFALGILQGLARCGLLDKFHYLSTVSGGGYIGSWLTAWIHHETENHKREEDKRAATGTPGTSQAVQPSVVGNPFSRLVGAFLRALKSKPTETAPYSAKDDPKWNSRRACAIGTVVGRLRRLNQEDPLHPEADPIRHLREYSNYLSPKLGFLSADTWTLVAIYLRNLTLNWLVILPLLAALLAIPRLCVAIVAHPPADCFWRQSWLAGLCFAGFFCMTLAIAYVGTNLPLNPKQRAPDPGDSTDIRLGQGAFLWGCLVLLILSAGSLTTLWAWLQKHLHGAHLAHEGFWFIVFGAAVQISALFLIIIRARRWPRVIDYIAVLTSGAMGGFILWITAVKCLPKLVSTPEAYVCFATPVLLAVFLLAMTLYIGIASLPFGKHEKIADPDLEWLARAEGWVLIAVVTWLVVSVLVLLGPRLLEFGLKTFSTIGGISGLITVLLGSSSRTKAKHQQDTSKVNSGIAKLIDKAPQLVAPVFVAFLVVLISIGTTFLIEKSMGWPCPATATEVAAGDAATPSNGQGEKVSARTDGGNKTASSDVKTPPTESKKSEWPQGFFGHRDVVRATPWWLALGFILAFAIFGYVWSRIVNVNIFSLHGMYRDRLIRAYLAASRPDHVRQPHPFTGFDRKDNIDMYCLWPQPPSRPDVKPGSSGNPCPHPLFPVVNIALNLVHGHNLAWQERKAESFTVSPLHCGSWAIGARSRKPKEWKGYRRTDMQSPHTEGYSHHGYADGITLGTAMTISGAAASPNMGYHSSPIVTFIMTLFNARLGWWLGNPGEPGDNKGYLSAEPYRRWYPASGVTPIVDEALGFTNDENKYVYLSDGGHFENLGLYEMVLRRSRYIVVSDAGADPECTFADLGEAIRKIRIDLGIPIEFPPPIYIYPRRDDDTRNKMGRRCAIGSIKYSAVDGKVADGVLIYIKPACYGNEPRDVYEYYKRSPLFPHESTVDQFFTESQFESYRMLGVHTMQELCKDTVKDFDSFEANVRTYLGNTSSPAVGGFHTQPVASGAESITREDSIAEKGPEFHV